MSQTDEPAVIQQRQLVETLAQLAATAVSGEWLSFELRIRKLAPWGQFDLVVTRPDGSSEKVMPPRGMGDSIDSLRSAMYRPGAGTWYSATIAVSREGSVTAAFDYDNEPAWSRPAEPIFYAQDLGKYPRDESAIPAWLKAQLELAPSDL